MKIKWFRRPIVIGTFPKFKFDHSCLVKFRKLSTLLFKIVFVNPRTYVFAFLLPLILSILFAWVWNSYTFYQFLPPILLNFLVISVFFTSFYLGIFLVEWRKKNFLKRIKMIGINQFDLLFVLFLINLTLVTVSFLLNLLCYNGYSLIAAFNFHIILLGNIRWFIWCFFAVGVILLTFFLTITNVFFATAWAKRSFAFIFLALTTLFSLAFSDVLINPTITNGNWWFIILGYLCPAKYFIWFNMLITSYQFLDPLGISQIVQNYNQQTFIVFNSLWETFVPMAIFIFGFTYLTSKYFKWGA